MQRKSDDTTTQRGREAEDMAARFLESRGQRVLKRNFRIRGGEIDLICREGTTLVFVEVRLRRRADFGGAAASITARKRQRIVLAARHFLARYGECDCRFDCILMSDTDEAQIEWLRGAFTADA